MGFSFLLLSISALLAILSSPVVTIQDYQPLRQPILYQSECAKNGVSESTSADNSTKPGTLHVNLSVRLTRFTSDYVDFNTRAYNQEIPAPTIKVCPGDRLVVILTNTLEAGNSNNTKLHVHGMHVSPVGDADNVMPIVRLENSDSVFMISARIIQQGHSDRPTDFPEPLAAMDDLVLILQTICIENCDNMDAEVPGALESKYSDDDMTGMTGMIGEESSDEKATWPTDLEVVEDEAVVNGQYLPSVDLNAGEHKRLHFVNAIANNLAELVVAKGSSCTLHVLAMDGIYFDKPKFKAVVVIVGIHIGDLATVTLKVMSETRTTDETKR